MKQTATACALLAGLAALTACAATPGPDSSFVSAPAAYAYLRAHPAAPEPGMVRGIVLDWTDASTSQNYAWTMEVAVPAGVTVTVTCGTPADPNACDYRGSGPAGCAPGNVGSYIYFPADDRVDDFDPYTVIKCGVLQS